MAPNTADTEAAKPEKAPRSRRRLWLRWLIGLLLLPFLLVAVLVVLVYLPPVQQFVRGKAEGILSERIGTKVALEGFHLRFPLGVTLTGLHVADLQGDTLLYAGRISTRAGLRKLLGGDLLLDPVELSDVRASLIQAADSTFNFQFIIDAFVGDTLSKEPKAETDTTGGMGFAVGSVHLERVHFNMRLEPSDLALDLHSGELELGFDLFALDPMAFHVDQLLLSDTRLDMRTVSGDPTPPSYPYLENPLADIDVRFQSMALERVAFSMTTTDTGDSLWLAVDQASIQARSLDHTRQQLALKEVELDGFQFGMLDKGGASPEVITEAPLWLDRNDGFRYWTQDWDLSIDRLRVANSRFAVHAQRIEAPALLFDPAHMVLGNIGVIANTVAVNNQRIAIALEQVDLMAGPGQERISLSSKLDATPARMSLSDGRLRAMDNAVNFNLEASPGNLSRAYRSPGTVPFDASVASPLRMTDLLPLLQQFGVELPAAAAADERWRTEVRVAGTASHLQQIGLALDGDQGTRIHVKASIQHAMDWPNSSFDLDVEDLVMGAGMRQVANAYAPPDVPMPKRISVRGKASGRKGWLRSSLALDSDLGRLTAVAEARDWKGALPDLLDLDLTAADVAVAQLIGDTAFAPLSFKLNAHGSDLHSSARQGALTLVPTRFTYQGNDLSSLRLDADARGDSVHVAMGSTAPAADMSLNVRARWPEPGDSVAMGLDLMLNTLQLQALGITAHELNARGLIAGRIAMKPDARGRITLQAPGLRIFNSEQAIGLERFTLKGLLDTDSTAVDLDCDVLRLAYHANLALDSTISLVRERLLGAFTEPYVFVPPAGRKLDLRVDLPGAERIISLIIPDLHALSLDRLEGRYDSESDALDLVIEMPDLDYGGIVVKDLRLSVDADGPDLEGNLAVGRVSRDSLHLDNLSLQASNAPGALRTLFRLSDGQRDNYRIGVDLRRENKVPVVHIQEDLVLDRRTWQARPGNALYLDPEGMRAVDLVLTNMEQKVELRTAPDGNHLDISGFQLSTITGLVRSTDSLALIHGKLDASVLIPLRELERLKADLQISELRVLEVALGTLTVALAEDRKDHYTGGFAVQAERNAVRATLEADLSGEASAVNISTNLDLGDLSRFKPLVDDYLFELDGALVGDLNYKQSGNDIAVIGRTALNDILIGPIQTGAVYSIQRDTVLFTDEGLVFNAFDVFDAKGNRFLLDGKVLTSSGTVPGLALRLRTERFQLVNSTAADNPFLYGKLFGSIDLNIAGTAIAPIVRGSVGVLDSTNLSLVLPGSSVELIDHEGIVEFTSDFDAMDTLAVLSDSELLRDSLAAQLPGVELDLRIRLDKRARFAVVIDPTTGDQATFSGECDLVFRYDPAGDIYLQGPFTVGEGGYTLEFYGLVKKRFDLVPGGTIIWDGDPLAGRMDLKAKFTTTAAPYPLVANARGGLTEAERNSLQARLPFDVLINFRETVQAPAISFGLDMDRQYRNSYPQVNTVLEQLSRSTNQEELNRQVFGLLVLSTFIENENSSDQGGSNLASTAARNSVNSILTQQLNRLTGQGIKGMDIQLGVNTYDQTEGGQSYSRTTVDYKVTQRILNDRISIEAGGSVGADERRQEMSGVSNTRAPQYAIAYDITKDGRLRLRVYHENAYDLYDGELVNNGVAIMLTRDFEKQPKEREKERQDILKQREAIRNEEEQGP